MSDRERRTESTSQPVGADRAMNPGDEAPPGTPGTGENICRDCGGSGKLNGKPCPTCGGTGRVIEVVSAGP